LRLFRVWWHTFAILALRRLKQEYLKFEDNKSRKTERKSNLLRVVKDSYHAQQVECFLPAPQLLLYPILYAPGPPKQKVGPGKKVFLSKLRRTVEIIFFL
jgi:hypothetical protein